MVFSFLPGGNSAKPMRRLVFEIAFGAPEPW